MSFNRIGAGACRELISGSETTIIDIRDAQSFNQGHIESALHVEEINLEDFVETEDKAKPLVIYCYHGNSSLSAAGWFSQKGFEKVYSLDGGYEDWVATRD